MDFNDLKNFREEIKKIISILGTSKKKPIDIEINSRKYARRSIVIKKNLNKNYKLKLSDLIIKRPGTGLPTKYIKNPPIFGYI